MFIVQFDNLHYDCDCPINGYETDSFVQIFIFSVLCVCLKVKGSCAGTWLWGEQPSAYD